MSIANQIKSTEPKYTCTYVPLKLRLERIWWSVATAWVHHTQQAPSTWPRPIIKASVATNGMLPRLAVDDFVWIKEAKQEKQRFLLEKSKRRPFEYIPPRCIQIYGIAMDHRQHVKRMVEATVAYLDDARPNSIEGAAEPSGNGTWHTGLKDEIRISFSVHMRHLATKIPQNEFKSDKVAHSRHVKEIFPGCDAKVRLVVFILRSCMYISNFSENI